MRLRRKAGEGRDEDGCRAPADQGQERQIHGKEAMRGRSTAEALSAQRAEEMRV